MKTRKNKHYKKNKIGGGYSDTDFDIDTINTLLSDFNDSNSTTFNSNQYKRIGAYVLNKLCRRRWLPSKCRSNRYV